MEVHAHSHTPRKKWTNYLWEFLMLFLAVFCGFLAENQREHYVEQQREKKYIFSLIQDLKADTANFESYIIRQRERRVAMDSLTMLLATGKYKQFGNETYLFARYVLGSAAFISTDGTLLQLKNAGNLRLIKKQLVVDSILAYDAHLKELQERDVVDIDIRNSFREMGGNIFKADIFYRVIDSNLNYVKPTNNPQLITDNATTINNIAFQIQYLSVIAKATLYHATRLKSEAINLIELLKKEYHLK